MTYPRPCRSWTLRPSQSAFSLVEVLVTICVLAVLMSASLPALFGNRRSAELTKAGNILADATSLSRQTALSKNTFVALIVVKPAPPARQALVVMEYDAANEMWKPVGSWIRLPVSASVVDMGTSQLVGNTKANAIAPLTLKFDGRTLSATDYSALVFYPDGRMENGNEQTRQLSARYATDSASTPSHSLPNYYDVVVNSSTSAFRIDRP